MADKNAQLTQLLSRLVTKEEQINMQYTSHLQNEASIYESNDMSRALETYAKLLDVIDLDEMYGMIRYRCDKILFDKFKSKSDINGSYYVGVEKRYELAHRLFKDCMTDAQMTYLANSTTIHPFDCATSDKKVDLAARMLLRVLNDKVKLDDDNKILFYKDGESFKAIKNYTDESFAIFLAAPLTGVMTAKEMQASLKIFKNEAARHYKQSNVIQFNDCYVEQGICKPGFYPDGFPRFMIKRNVYQAYLTRKTTVHSKALDQLVLNLCNYDETTKERFMDVISTVFLNDSSFKKKYNFSPRIVGKDGANGKSSFRTVVENAFRSVESTSSDDKSVGGNVCSFETKDLNNSRTTYRVVNSLIAIDGDSSTAQINEDACSVFKQITSGDDVLIRPLYGESFERTAIAMMINFSNDFPASSDKSAAYLRRLEYIECEYQILDKEHERELGVNSKLQKFEVNDDWFDEIKSDDAAQYLIEDMIIRAARILETRKISPASQHMIDLKMEFAFSNNSSLAFLKEFEESSIVGFSVKEVKEKYREWCEENDLTIMKRKFNETLESKGFVRIRSSFKQLNVDSSKFYECRETGTSVNAWHYSDKDKDQAYFDRMHAENEYDYKVDKSVDNSGKFKAIDQELYSNEISLVKLFIARSESRDTKILNRPVSSVFEDFESFLDEIECEKISRVTFNKVMESLGYRRKNLAFARVELTDEEREIETQKNTKVMGCWIKADTEE